MSRPDRTSKPLHVDASDAGVTLAAFIRKQRKLSWGDAELRIMGRRVAVHGNICLDPARRLKNGDVVHLLEEAAPKPPEPEQIDILFRDRHIVVVDKPAGLISAREPRENALSAKRRERQPTLDELLDKRLRRPHDRDKTIFPVHRLDRDTSGLMLFARTPDVERSLVSMFQAHDLERIYQAVVHNGQPNTQTISTLIARDRGDGKRGSVPHDTADKSAKRAVTQVKPVGMAAGNRAIVECQLETGRTHQIRIHLAEKGHPVCGDKTYGLRGEPDPPPRQALHAYVLAFEHPDNGRPMRFDSPLPRDLDGWLRRLK